ncbi:MAG: hypothetical protein JWP89_2656 [Schlesneria sp.]|nr:hypothetical protein [Schlesneria sp.]
MPEIGDIVQQYDREVDKIRFYKTADKGKLIPTRICMYDIVIVEITKAEPLGLGPRLRLMRATNWKCEGVFDPEYECELHLELQEPIKTDEIIGSRIRGKVLDVHNNRFILTFVDFLSPEHATLHQLFSPTVQQIALIGEYIKKIHDPVVDMVRDLVAPLEGRSFTEEGKQVIVGGLQQLFRSLAVGVVCPKTKKVGTLRLKRAGRDKRLVFEIQVWENGRRTSHFSSSTFPKLDVQYLPVEENS